VLRSWQPNNVSPGIKSRGDDNPTGHPSHYSSKLQPKSNTGARLVVRRLSKGRESGGQRMQVVAVVIEVESGQTAAIDSPPLCGVQFPASGAQRAQGTRALTHGRNRRSTGERKRAARHGHGMEKMCAQRAPRRRMIAVYLGAKGSSGSAATAGSRHSKHLREWGCNSALVKRPWNCAVWSDIALCRLAVQAACFCPPSSKPLWKPGTAVNVGLLGKTALVIQQSVSYYQ